MLSLPLSVGKKVWLEAEAETKEPEQSHSYSLFLWSPDIVLASLYSEDKPLMILLSKANKQINKYALYLGLLGFPFLSILEVLYILCLYEGTGRFGHSGTGP